MGLSTIKLLTYLPTYGDVPLSCSFVLSSYISLGVNANNGERVSHLYKSCVVIFVLDITTDFV
jgi:hypothetical protein